MKNLLKVSCISLVTAVSLIAGPADSIENGPTIGGSVSDSSKNESTVISVGGAKYKNSEADGLSKDGGTIGSVQGTETDIGNVKVSKGNVTGSVTNDSTNKGTVVNVGTKVQKGSINMTNGSAGSITNSAENEGTTVSVGGGDFKLKTKDISSTEVKVGNSANTETDIGSINVDGANVEDEISNAGMKNSGTTVNVGGVVKKGAISAEGGKAKSIDDSSQNTGNIVNIGGGSFKTKALGGISSMDLEVGNQQATESDVGSVELNSGDVKGAVTDSSKNNASVVNVGSTVKEGSVQIGD